MAAFLVTSGWRGGLANIAVANWGTSFIFGRGLRLPNKRRPSGLGGDPEGRLESIAVHDDALALLNRTSGELFRGRRFTPSGFSLDDSCRRGFSFYSRNSYKGTDK
jgi:hypothetical protein